MEELTWLIPHAPVPSQAILVTGSHAWGKADKWSDIDVVLLAPEERETVTDYLEGQLVTWSIAPLEVRLATLNQPKAAPFAVPAYRHGLLVVDPEGLGRHLVAEAHAWTWDRLDPRFPEHEMTSIIEDVHKVAGALELGQMERGFDASVVVIFACASVLAVHFRVFVESQNEYFSSICANSRDPEITRFLTGVVGLDRRSTTLAERLDLTLRLYVRTAELVAIQSPVVRECISRIKAVLR